MELQSIKDSIDSYGSSIQQRVGERDLLQRQKELYQAEILDIETKLVLLDKIAVLFNSFGETEQNDLKDKIELLVTYGLQSVFQERIEFKIISEIKGKQVVMRFVLKSGDIETDILDARGGGVAVVAGFILQIIIVFLLKGRVAPIVILDEGLSQLSEGYRVRMASVMKELVDKTGIQIVLVTHQKEYVDVADKACLFEKDKHGYTVVSNMEK